MSGELSFLVRSGQQDAALVENPTQSVSLHKVFLSAEGQIARPVDVARALTRAGVRLRTAHTILGQIVQGEPATVEIDSAHSAGLIAELREMGVRVARTGSQSHSVG